jgi:uncharacterized membrane protein YozB (DUF420 family)
VKGFLGSYANFGADLNLVLQILMGVALLVGRWLARVKRYRAHAACQTAVLILNFFLIAFLMWPSFQKHVEPRLPARLLRPFVFVATVHGVLGALAEVFGLYILLVAGTDILPQSWRFRRWKLWMRIELALWWTVLITGTVTYFIWYVPQARP